VDVEDIEPFIKSSLFEDNRDHFAMIKELKLGLSSFLQPRSMNDTNKRVMNNCFMIIKIYSI
jgi:hypothetical protein